MKQSVLVVTTVMILLGGVVTVALIQSAEAATVNTTRSNIKHAMKKKEVKGRDNQLSTQEVIIQQINNAENKCGDGTECSNTATFETGAITAGSSTREQAVSVDVGDISKSVSDHSNSFEGDPIPGVDVKLGKNPGGLACC